MVGNRTLLANGVVLSATPIPPGRMEWWFEQALARAHNVLVEHLLLRSIGCGNSGSLFIQGLRGCSKDSDRINVAWCEARPMGLNLLAIDIKADATFGAVRHRLRQPSGLDLVVLRPGAWGIHSNQRVPEVRCRRKTER